ncbi:small multidrug resistance protein [Isosphaera pallida ATCC 43644]|jgi:quaternary ammonium compound-resistance protein SugE|uniref:Guanidinium exporter n=1 Tax=Isosphaera pallida (strain ATCC 43644 / DSM 9630 / IS1B) TaxID=575540 RepID=E8R444_ISOPI|nr:multidrug efflux SMR transporter [Isosphaera pallida]ADV61631.1 small multidrug resistance protein [Isosphaera pallida ATCC 43644]
MSLLNPHLPLTTGTAWLILILAGGFEVGFAVCLKLSEGFSKPLPTLGFAVFAALSFYLLTVAARVLPIGTAYAVWTGIGAFGTAVVGILLFKDSAAPARLALLVLLIGSVIGLKLVGD